MTRAETIRSDARPTGPSREEFSERLLKGSVKKSYEPVVDIDWDAPLDPDKFFLPPRLVSLYGTPMWDEMTREQQIELSRQELVNTLSAGIWFENMLNQSLLRTILHEDPTSRSTHYKLTELGDETRHMVMFGKAIERVGAKPVQPKRFHRYIINALPLAFQRGSMLWVAALIGEEIFDSLQRQMMDDPELQPIIQRLMRIHVTEEARHIQFARDGRANGSPRCPGSTAGSWPTSTGWAATSSIICSATRSPMRVPAWTPSGPERPRAPAPIAARSRSRGSLPWRRS